MIAVLGMFNPLLLGIIDNNHYVIQEASKSLPEDPYDEEFLRETSVIIQKTFNIYIIYIQWCIGKYNYGYTHKKKFSLITK